tara:strand:+ start:1600 stop:1956 length:357 start_codon:yes stop_codon:yes gene_type:complete
MDLETVIVSVKKLLAPEKKYYLSNSNIHGTGTFSTQNIQAGEKIEVGIDYDDVMKIFPFVTDYFGKWINHSWKPNSHLEYIDNKYYAVASVPISKDSEITMNYNDTPWYICPPNPNWN